MEPDPKSLSTRILAARVAAGMTQMELAVKAKIALSTLGQLEQGRMENPRLATLRALAKALGVDLNALAGDDGQAAQETPKK